MEIVSHDPSGNATEIQLTTKENPGIGLKARLDPESLIKSFLPPYLGV